MDSTYFFNKIICALYPHPIKEWGFTAQYYKRADVNAYCQRGKSAFFEDKSFKRIPIIKAFIDIASYNIDTAHYWLSKLERISDTNIDIILNSLPDAWMSVTSKKFVKKLLKINAQNLKNINF